MPIGTFTAHLTLDNPSLIHCGPSDPVTGILTLRYHANPKSPTPEFFGPLSAAVILHGRAKTKILQQQNTAGAGAGTRQVTYRGRAPLFEVGTQVHQGPIRVVDGGAIAFPFQLRFPEYTMQGVGFWPEDARWHSRPGAPLPPSFMLEHRGFGGRFDAFVEYRVGVQARSEGIDVRIDGLGEEGERVVLYEQPRMRGSERNTALRWMEAERSVRSALLLPEAARPHGAWAKTKAWISRGLPSFSAKITLGIPIHVYQGEPLEFAVKVGDFAIHAGSTADPKHLDTEVDITFVSLGCSLNALTEVRAESNIFTSPERNSNKTAAVHQGAVSSPGPFAKREDWTKTIRTDRLAAVPSSFKTYIICQQYTIHVECVVKCLGEKWSIEYELPVLVHPPLLDDRATAVGPAESTSPRQQVQPLESVADIGNALPSYDRPPEYESVAETSTTASTEAENRKSQNVN